jgi:hypothetical protein
VDADAEELKSRARDLSGREQMTPEHLKTLAETLAALKPLHARLDAIADQLQRAYDDQGGEWRFSAEGDAAAGELHGLEDIAGNLYASMEALREFVFLLSDDPDFASVMPERFEYAPVPDKLPSREEIFAIPRRPGAPAYPFLKRPEGDAGPGPEPDPVS